MFPKRSRTKRRSASHRMLYTPWYNPRSIISNDKNETAYSSSSPSDKVRSCYPSPSSVFSPSTFPPPHSSFVRNSLFSHRLSSHKKKIGEPPGPLPPPSSSPHLQPYLLLLRPYSSKREGEEDSSLTRPAFPPPDPSSLSPEKGDQERGGLKKKLFNSFSSQTPPPALYLQSPSPLARREKMKEET